mgnify:FL=1
MFVTFFVQRKMSFVHFLEKNTTFFFTCIEEDKRRSYLKIKTEISLLTIDKPQHKNLLLLVL